MGKRAKSLIEIHLAVFLFGLSGLFGKLISLPSIIIVFGRVFFSSIFLLIIIFYFKKDIKIKERKHFLIFILMGVILAIHWCTFFKSIQMSTVAIGLLTFTTFPVFVTFLEPYFSKERIKLSDVTIAIVTFLGILLIIPKFDGANNITQGVLWGVLSGFTYAIISILNRTYVAKYSGIVIAFYEQLIATIALVPYIILQKSTFYLKDILLLILLGVVFTAISHSLFINGLKQVKTQTAAIISSLEPVYGIIFAAILIKELPTSREMLGGIVILIAVFYSTIKSK